MGARVVYPKVEVMKQVVERTLYAALGGQSNIVQIDSYRMRIRVQVRSQAKVNEDALRVSPVLAVVRTQDFVQIVAGTQAEQIGADMILLHSSPMTETV